MRVLAIEVLDVLMPLLITLMAWRLLSSLRSSDPGGRISLSANSFATADTSQ